MKNKSVTVTEVVDALFDDNKIISYFEKKRRGDPVTEDGLSKLVKKKMKKLIDKREKDDKVIS